MDKHKWILTFQSYNNTSWGLEYMTNSNTCYNNAK